MSHLIELVQLYMDLSSFDVSQHEKDEWIISSSLTSMLTFGGPIPMSQFLSSDSNNLNDGVWAALDFYYLELPGDSSFCAKHGSDELSFDKPCEDNLKTYREDNGITQETSSSHSLSLLVERQKRQTFVALDNVGNTINSFVGLKGNEAKSYFKLRSNLRDILMNYINHLEIISPWLSTENPSECGPVLDFIISGLKNRQIEGIDCQTLKHLYKGQSEQTRKRRSLIDLFSDTPDLVDRVRELANHNLQSSQTLMDNQIKMSKSLAQEDKVIRTFMSQTLAEESNLHKMLNRMLSTSSYSKYLMKRQIEKLSLSSTLSSLSNRAQSLLQQQNAEIKQLLEMSTGGLASCNIIKKEITCSSSSIHFTGTDGESLRLQYLASPYAIAQATVISCLYLPSGINCS